MNDDTLERKLELIQGGDHGRDIQAFAESVYQDPTLTIGRITPGIFSGMLDNVIDKVRPEFGTIYGEVLNASSADVLRDYGEQLIGQLLARFRLDKEYAGESYSDDEMHADHELLEGMLEDIIAQRQS